MTPSTSRIPPVTNCHILIWLTVLGMTLTAPGRTSADTSLLSADRMRVRLPVQLKAEPFDLSQVSLLDGPFREAMLREGEYLMSLEADRLLHTFRLNAGLPSTAQPLGGWEEPKCEVRGHFVGHYLSGCALMYASTGDERYRQRAALLVEELASCQQALGSSGYLSAFPESFIDRVESLQPVWAPYYTLHKIMAGLLDIHVYCHNAQALQVVEGMARWCQSRCEKLSDQQMQQMLNRTEQGGMNEVLANLSAVTGKPEYLALSCRFVQRTYVEPLAAGRDELKGQHVNSFIPNIIGTARQYELTGNEDDRRIVDFFWHQVTRHRCYCTGGTSNEEHWRTEPECLAGELGDRTQETCCTYNMLKLTRHLFAWDPQVEYADYYELALFNSILSTQDPKTGMMMYFVTLGPGRWKFYNTPTSSFWCCTGTGVENHAQYGGEIYWQDAEGLIVNQFIASELDWSPQGVRIRQETQFPEVSSTTLKVLSTEPREFTIRVRIPSWTTKEAQVRLNGQPVAVAVEPGSYLALRRTWQNGDALQLTLPMSLRLTPMPDDPTVAAFMVGPLVLAGKLGGEGLTNEHVYQQQNWYQFPRHEIAPAPVLISQQDDLTRILQRVEGVPLTYRTVNLEQNVTLVPYHQLFGERYTVYWRVLREGSPEHVQFVEAEQARQERAARVVDEVILGDTASESSHQLQGQHSASGSHLGKFWRDASQGGQFSYQMKVQNDVPLSLCVTYWGSDSGNRVFDILLDGQKLATEQLEGSKPGEFFEVEYPISADAVKGKQQVTVTFQAHPEAMAGGIFGLSVMRQNRDVP